MLVRLILGSSTEGKLLLSTSTPSLGAPPNFINYTIKQFSGAIAGDFGAVARGVSHSQGLFGNCNPGGIPAFSRGEFDPSTEVGNKIPRFYTCFFRFPAGILRACLALEV